MSHEPAPDTQRIAKFLARCGVASRRKAEDLVTAGRVALNGVVFTDLGRQVDPQRDVVTVDGRAIQPVVDNATYALNKPRLVVVSRFDPEGRKTIFDLLPVELGPISSRLVHVGRLDYLSQGLLIVTTDGELAHRLSHPSLHVEKEYVVRLERALRPEELDRLRAGIELADGPAKPRRIEVIGNERSSSYRIVLEEGRNRIIRRMMEALNVSIRSLVRVRIGQLELGSLGEGEWRQLSREDIALLANLGKTRSEAR